MNQEVSVDLLCIGSGPAGLAAAIAAADRGMTAWIADTDGAPAPGRPTPGDTWVDVLQHRWGTEAFSEFTAWYLHILTKDLPPPRNASAPSEPSRITPVVTPQCREDGTVEPFIGAELTGWAYDCLRSPYGFICSRIDRDAATELRLDGRPIDVVAAASLPARQLSGSHLGQWLVDEARKRGVAVCRAAPLRRLLFSGGQIVGARIQTPDGDSLEVRARREVLISTAGRQPDTALPRYPVAADTRVDVSLVSRSASRFGRIEFLTTDKDAVMATTAAMRPRSERVGSGRPHGSVRTRASLNY